MQPELLSSRTSSTGRTVGWSDIGCTPRSSRCQCSGASKNCVSQFKCNGTPPTPKLVDDFRLCQSISIERIMENWFFIRHLANSEGNVREWEEKRRKEMEAHHH